MNKEDKVFPSLDLDKNYSQNKILSMAQSGLSARDYIAIKAMQGILSGRFDDLSTSNVAVDAYDIADAMIDISNEKPLEE